MSVCWRLSLKSKLLRCIDIYIYIFLLCIDRPFHLVIATLPHTCPPLEEATLHAPCSGANAHPPTSKHRRPSHFCVHLLEPCRNTKQIYQMLNLQRKCNFAASTFVQNKMHSKRKWNQKEALQRDCNNVDMRIEEIQNGLLLRMLIPSITESSLLTYSIGQAFAKFLELPARECSARTDKMKSMERFWNMWKIVKPPWNQLAETNSMPSERSLPSTKSSASRPF